MHSLSVLADPPDAAAIRMVWLPGAYQTAQDFLTAGFADAVLARKTALDLEFVDLQMAHVGDRSALQQLRSAIVLPARTLGIEVWLGGISLGGLMALDYAATNPDEVAGLCLIAPYLGNRILTAEIAHAPGLAAWQPGKLAQTDEEHRIWSFIKNRGIDSHPVYLGFGRSDRFLAAQELLAAALPANSVKVIDGGHDWPTWFRLWENFLDWRFA